MTTQAIATTPALINVFEDIIGTARQLVVNARELHTFLQVGKVFAAWIQERIGKYEFVENEDFIAIFQNRKIGHGRGKVEYHLSLDMAKELSMVENNAKGREARRYFIAMEKKALAIPTPNTPREYLTNNDMQNLKRLVWQVSHQMKFKDCFIHAVWYCLRDVTGVPSPAKFEVQHLPAMAQEFKRIMGIVEQYAIVKADVETQILKHCIRQKNDHLLPYYLDQIRQSAAEQQNEVQTILEKTFPSDCLALIKREQAARVSYDEYSEPR